MVDANPSTSTSSIKSDGICASVPEEEELEDEQELPYYNMSGDKQLLIFNHFEYQNPNIPVRHGTAQDVKRMTEVFKALNFNVTLYQDLTYKGIIKALEDLCIHTNSEVRTSCLAVCILTHGGGKGSLSAHDRSYRLSEIFDVFENCHESLIGIPKLFFIQACRGNNLDSGRIKKDSISRNAVLIPTHADMLVLYSTVEGFVSFRNWMIPALCDVIEGHKNLDILGMVTLVQNRVAYHCLSYHTNKILNDKKQMPETKFTLTKFLKLWN